MGTKHSHELSGSVIPTITVAAQLGAAALVFRPNDSIAYVNSDAALLYPFCEFNAHAADLRSWFFSTLRAGQITQKEALADPSGWVGHIAAARRMNKRLEFIREYTNGKKVLCSHVNFEDGWSAQVRIDITNSKFSPSINNDEALPFYAQYYIMKKDIQRFQNIQDRLNIGIAIVSEDCKILQSNSAFRDAVEREDGFKYNDANQFEAILAADQERLRSALSVSSSAHCIWKQKVLKINRPSSSIPHIVSVSKATDWPAGSSILVISPFNFDDIGLIEILRGDFGLTKAQALIACSISMGENASSISDKLSISKETVYTQIKRTFKRLYGRSIVLNGQQGLVHLLSLIRSVSSHHQKQ